MTLTQLLERYDPSLMGIVDNRQMQMDDRLYFVGDGFAVRLLDAGHPDDEFISVLVPGDQLPEFMQALTAHDIPFSTMKGAPCS